MSELDYLSSYRQLETLKSLLFEAHLRIVRANGSFANARLRTGRDLSLEKTLYKNVFSNSMLGGKDKKHAGKIRSSFELPGPDNRVCIIRKQKLQYRVVMTRVDRTVRRMRYR